MTFYLGTKEETSETWNAQKKRKHKYNFLDPVNEKTNKTIQSENHYKIELPYNTGTKPYLNQNGTISLPEGTLLQPLERRQTLKLKISFSRQTIFGKKQKKVKKSYRTDPVVKIPL